MWAGLSSAGCLTQLDPNLGKRCGTQGMYVLSTYGHATLIECRAHSEPCCGELKSFV
jgi:hypothetical protein